MVGVSELEEELAQLESILGRLQAEVMQSNGILERVQVRERQKQQELAMLAQQLAVNQENLMRAEKLAHTSHAFVKQSLQNNGQIPPQIRAKLHLLDVAHTQVLTGMENNPIQVQQPIRQVQRQAPSPRTSLSDINTEPQQVQKPHIQSHVLKSPSQPQAVTHEETTEDQDNYQYFGLSSF